MTDTSTTTMGRVRMLRVREVCERGGFGRTKFFELAKAGAFKTKKAGARLTLVDEAEFERWAHGLPSPSNKHGKR